MTIGPDPITQIERRSRRSGNAHLLDPRLDQVPRVVGPGPGLWMELHRAGTLAWEREPLDGAVVERDVSDLGTVPLDREAMVLARDEHAVRAQVEHRVVRTAVAERELEGLESRRQREQLMAEADAEERDAADQLGDDGRLRGG